MGRGRLNADRPEGVSKEFRIAAEGYSRLADARQQSNCRALIPISITRSFIPIPFKPSSLTFRARLASRLSGRGSPVLHSKS